MGRLPQEHSERARKTPARTKPECEGEIPVLRPADAGSEGRMSQLARMIELEIIPRLMLVHRSAPESVGSGDAAEEPIGMEEVKRFTKLVLSHDEDVAFSTIQALRARDVPVERIYLELLAPTARYLGVLWDEDLCNFTDVTVGLGRLQRVLRELSPALGRSVDHPAEGRRVLLMPCSGEQHTFGLVMVSEFFRSAGWDVTGGAWAEGYDAAALVSGEWFDCVGFSLGARIHLSVLTESIQKVRQASSNRDLIILVGGPIFTLEPALVEQVGADGMTTDGREAPVLAESLITRSTDRLRRPLG